MFLLKPDPREKLHPESRATAALVMPQLHTADFALELLGERLNQASQRKRPADRNQRAVRSSAELSGSVVRPINQASAVTYFASPSAFGARKCMTRGFVEYHRLGTHRS